MTVKFGKYIVEGEIGRGGFGRVYCAFDGDMQRRIAIKELVSEADPDLLSRFQAEAGTTASLTHKNIVTVYEYGQHNGRPYLVMELLEGRTLHEIIATGDTLPLLEKVEIMYQVAEGLQHAHLRGVIHRDVKPGNVMVLAEGRVKIMDFGIARLLNSAASSRKTREGDLIGTVLYMAPESFREHEADKRTDIFAYGVLYYEFLTGEHPFQAKDVFSVIHRVTNDEPTPLSEKVIDCPNALELLIGRLMMKDRESRYDDLADVLFDTEPILRQLRQERASLLAREVERLLSLDDFEAVQARVKQILSLDPGNSQALVWQDKIRERTNRKRSDKLRQQGLEHMSAARYKDAALCFENALHFNAGKSEISALLEEARTALEKVRRAARIVSDARTQREGGNLETAFSMLAEAVEIDPANSEAAQLRESLRHQIRELQTDARLSECQELRRQGRYVEALEALDSIDSDLQARGDIVRARQQTSDERREAERQQRRREFRQQFQLAKRFLRELQFEQAVEAAENLYVHFPEEPDASEFRDQVRWQFETYKRAEEVAGWSHAAEALLQSQRFDEAAQLVAQGLRKYSGEPALLRLAEMVKRAAAESARGLSLRGAVAHAQALSQAGSLDAALDLVRETRTSFGDSDGLVACESEIREGLARRDYKQSFENLLAEARQALEAGGASRALQLLRGSSSRYAAEGRFNQLLEVARISAAEQERELALGRHVQKIAAALQAQDWDAASIRFEAASREFPSAPQLADLQPAIAAGQRRHRLNSLRDRVTCALHSGDLKRAQDVLDGAAAEFFHDAAWQSLQNELENRDRYRAALADAEAAFARGELTGPIGRLEMLLTGAPDNRAEELYHRILEAKRLRQIDRQTQQREVERARAEEGRRKERETAIAGELARSAEEGRKNEWKSALEILKQACREYPESGSLREECQRVAGQFEDWRKRQKELRRHGRAKEPPLTREQVIEAGRKKAGACARDGDLAAAVATLETLSKRYPNSSEVRRDLQAASQELQYQREVQGRHSPMDSRLSLGRQLQKGGREAAGLLKDGKVADALSFLKGLVNKEKK